MQRVDHTAAGYISPMLDQEKVTIVEKQEVFTCKIFPLRLQHLESTMLILV